MQVWIVFSVSLSGPEGKPTIQGVYYSHNEARLARIKLRRSNYAIEVWVERHNVK